MTRVVEHVYTDTDNEIHISVYVNGQLLADHTTITRVVLELGKEENLLSAAPYQTIDSSVDTTAFDMTNPAKLILFLGKVTIPKGRHNCSVTVYTSQYPNGITLDTNVELRVA